MLIVTNHLENIVNELKSFEKIYIDDLTIRINSLSFNYNEPPETKGVKGDF